MNQLIQTIRINQKAYPVEMAKQANVHTPSPLQLLFTGQYGADSFPLSLANFLTEWFDEKTTLKVHTSGSTGTPKELFVEKQRMLNSARATINFLGLKKGDTALLCMPLPYIAGKMVVVRALTAELNLLLVTPCGHPLHAISQIPTFAAMTPMQVFNSLEVPEEREILMQIEHLIIGGGAIDSKMAEVLHTFPRNVWSTYGMTETLSHIALRRLSGTAASHWYTPFEGVTLSLSKENTLVIDAPNVCPEILQTNDIVTFNELGQFRILGRKDNTINTGGIKVQIEEVEAKLHDLLTFPFLITSAPDPKFGEHIVLLAEGNYPPEEVLQKAFAHLPTYWRPKTTVIVDQLPLTGTGKPDRAKAKQLVQSKQML